MGCELCGTRHDKAKQAEKRDVGSGVDDDQEGSSHGFMVPRAPGLGLRQPWKRAENVYGAACVGSASGHPAVGKHGHTRATTGEELGSSSSPRAHSPGSLACAPIPLLARWTNQPAYGRGEPLWLARLIALASALTSMLTGSGGISSRRWQASADQPLLRSAIWRRNPVG